MVPLTEAINLTRFDRAERCDVSRCHDLASNGPFPFCPIVEFLVSTGPDYDLKERIKLANPIEDLVESYVGRLRRQGSSFVCHCPWHDDQKPSLNVNPARQSWVCWVCDIRGDVFDFVMRREGVEFIEAMKMLAERKGIPFTSSQSRIKKGSAQDKQMLFQATQWAEGQFHDFLLQSESAIVVRDYLAKRGISNESIDEFKIGFAPVSFTWLQDRSRHTNFTPEILQACGLVVQNDRGWYERFRGRVIFPIRDTMQRAIAFGGRVVPGVFSADKEPPAKYINSPETRLFAKSETLYGLNLVRDTVSRSRKLTIVEGYTDVVAAWQAGLKNVVAVLGTALNEKHIRLIRRFADEITLVLDGDTAGQTRANQILDLFVSNEIDLRILSLPENTDPFDFLMQNGSEPFQKMVDGAPDAIEHKIRVETAGIDLINDTHRSNQALDRVLQTLARIPVSVLSGSAGSVLRQDQLLTRISRKFQLNLDQLRNRLIELRSALRKTKRPGGEIETVESAHVDFAKLDPKERELIELILGDESLLDPALETISPGQFSEGPLKELYEEIVESFHQGNPVTYQLLILHIEDPRLKNLLLGLQDAYETKRDVISQNNDFRIDPREQLEQVFRAFDSVAVDTENHATISQLQQGNIDEQEEASKLENLLKQTQQRQGITGPTDGTQL